MEGRREAEDDRTPFWRAAVPHVVAAGTAAYVVWVLWLTAVS